MTDQLFALPNVATPTWYSVESSEIQGEYTLQIAHPLDTVDDVSQDQMIELFWAKAQKAQFRRMRYYSVRRQLDSSVVLDLQFIGGFDQRIVPIVSSSLFGTMVPQSIFRSKGMRKSGRLLIT